MFDDSVSGWIGFSSVTEDTIDTAVGSIVSDETIVTLEWSLSNAKHKKG